MTMSSKADAAPTESMQEVFRELDHELQQQLTLWEAIRKTDIPAFNELVHEKNVPSLGVLPWLFVPIRTATVFTDPA